MFKSRKVFLIGLVTFGLIGCSDPKPVNIDINEAAANEGLAPEDYEVHENGAIEVYSKVDDTEHNNRPLAATGNNWDDVVTNGLLVADKYAMDNNSSAVFAMSNPSTNLDKQYGGEYEGQYFLTVVNDNGGNTSYAQLQPLFDINQSSDNLEDQLNNDTPLWKVVLAKYNGREF